MRHKKGEKSPTWKDGGRGKRANAAEGACEEMFAPPEKNTWLCDVADFHTATLHFPS